MNTGGTVVATAPTPETVVWSMPGLGVADAIAVTNVGVPDLDTLSLGGRDSPVCE